MKPLRIFVSYARADQVSCHELTACLQTFEERHQLRVWYDRRILPGSEFAPEIEHHLQESDAVVLLVTKDFLASDYCIRKELPFAMTLQQSGKARVIPVILEECAWQTESFCADLARGHAGGGRKRTSWFGCSYTCPRG